MPCRTAIALLTLTALLPLVPSAAHAQSAWTRLEVELGPLDADQHYQGLVEGYEHPIEGGAFTAYGVRVTISGAGARATASVDGGAPQTLDDPAHLLRLPTSAGERAVLITRHGDRRVWSAHWGVRFELAGLRYAIIDADADGALWEPVKGSRVHDVIVGPDSLTACPLGEAIWTRAGGFELRGAAGYGEARSLELPDKGEAIGKAWTAFNFLRAAAGVRPAKWSERMWRGCDAHVRYTHKNETAGGYEERGKPGFSYAGRTAGKQSVFGYAYRDAYKAVLEQFRTGHMLSYVIDPRISHSALAIHEDHFACNVLGGRHGPMPEGHVKVLWPPHGMQYAFRRFNVHGENPMPIPGQERDFGKLGGKVGAPVMAVVDDHEDEWILALYDADKRPVRCFKFSPNKEQPRVIVTPLEPLARRSRYHAELRRNGAVLRQWWFRTR